ncbi:MAG: class I SAM-dependent methyltransferase [Gemmataceae bacterium]
MADSSFGPLRIWDGARPAAMRGTGTAGFDLCDDELISLHPLAERLAALEILRAPLSDPDGPDPLSLQWYLSIEQVRHNRQGRWFSSLLEFGKHHGDRLLGLGVGLGSDLVQYARHGAEVVAACSSADQLALVRRNFALRSLPATFLHASPTKLPLESASIDVAVLTGLLHEGTDVVALLEEVYRVLKPGGKALAVVPAHYDITYWASLCGLWADGSEHAVPAGGVSLLSTAARRFRRADLRHLFHRFHEIRVWKRHLRRAEVPHLWRWLPLGLLERLVGRLLVLRGFKPVSAARIEQAAA